MATHHISIRKAGPTRIPSLTQAIAEAGDVLTFEAAEGADTILCLAPETVAAIHPSPGSSNVELEGGASVSFELGAVSPGNYVVELQAKGFPPPASIAAGAATGQALLIVRPAGGLDFPDPPEVPVGT